MAQIIGTSGAWKDVLKRLKTINVEVSHPQEIQLKIKALEQYYEKLRADFEREVQDLKNAIQKQEFTLKNNIAIIKESAKNVIQKLDLQIARKEKEFQRNYEHALNKLPEEFEQELWDLRNTVHKQEVTLESDIKAITESAQKNIQKLDQQLAQIEKEMANDVQFFDEKIVQINQLYEGKIKEFDKQLNYKPPEFYKTIEFLNNEITLKSQRFLNKNESFNLEIRTEFYNLRTAKGLFKKFLILLGIFGIKIRQWKFLFVEKSDVARLKIQKREILRAEENRVAKIRKAKYYVKHKKDRNISAIITSKSKSIRNSEIQIKSIKERQHTIQVDEDNNIQFIHTNLNENRKKLQYFEHNRPEIMAKRRQHLDITTAAWKETQIKNITNRQHSIRTKEAEDIQKLHTKFNNSRKKLQHFEQNRPAIMAKRRQYLDDEIEFLKEILSSNELIGAITELEVIEYLSYLPNFCYVLNDVHLQTNRPVYVQKKAVLSAQVDHIVITPAGIFIIETKHWSKQFVESNNFFDPYEQVTRASHLCYKLLKMNFNKEIKTRSILAYRGYLPKKKAKDYVKVLTIQDVKAYIAWFKTPIFSEKEVLKIKDFLSSCKK